MTDKIPWDWDALTADEAEDLEEVAQAPVPAIIAAIKAGMPTVRMLRGIVWISRRRNDPDLTYQDVADQDETYVHLTDQATAITSNDS